MNRKKLNIFLFPMTILIWIVIFLRIFSLSSPQRIDELIHTPDPVQVTEIDTSDTLNLLLNYPDPFNTNRFLPVKSRGSLHNNNSSKNFFEKKVEPAIPSVSFLGTINSGEHSKKVALLVVNGKSALVSQNDSVGGFKVIDCWRDSVRLKFDKRMIIVKH